MWRLPLHDDYKDGLKSDIADLNNISSQRGAGSIVAALFMREFTGGVPWAHLDIAGTAFAERDGTLGPKGGTGVAVRTLLAYLTRAARQPTLGRTHGGRGGSALPHHGVGRHAVAAGAGPRGGAPRRARPRRHGPRLHRGPGGRYGGGGRRSGRSPSSPASRSTATSRAPRSTSSATAWTTRRPGSRNSAAPSGRSAASACHRMAERLADAGHAHRSGGGVRDRQGGLGGAPARGAGHGAARLREERARRLRPLSRRRQARPRAPQEAHAGGCGAADAPCGRRARLRAPGARRA